MAGGGDQADNPVAINVVPMVDVIFCLCVFFMCSFKFKQLEGKFDSWLPKDKGTEGLPSLDLIKEVRVALLWDEQKNVVVRKLGTREFGDDPSLQEAIAKAHQMWVDQGKPDAPVTIDADRRCPWAQVVNVVNLIKRCQINKIEFALGAPPKKTPGK